MKPSSTNAQVALYIGMMLIVITGMVAFTNWRYKACRADGLSHNTCFWMVLR